MPYPPGSCSNNLGYLDAVMIFYCHDFTAGEEFLVHVQIHGCVGNFVELHHGAWRELKNLLHWQAATAKFNGHLDRYIQEHGEIRRRFVGTHNCSLTGAL